MLRDGDKVSYVGWSLRGDKGLNIGDEGLVLSADNDASHIHWRTGALNGKVTLTRNDDVVAAVMPAVASAGDYLWDQPLVTTAVKETYERFGADGLINALDSEGHLAHLSSIADQAMATIDNGLRNDPAISEVLASLEPAEAEAFVNHLSVALLRDTLSGEAE